MLDRQCLIACPPHAYIPTHTGQASGGQYQIQAFDAETMDPVGSVTFPSYGFGIFGAAVDEENGFGYFFPVTNSQGRIFKVNLETIAAAGTLSLSVNSAFTGVVHDGILYVTTGMNPTRKYSAERMPGRGLCIDAC